MSGTSGKKKIIIYIILSLLIVSALTPVFFILQRRADQRLEALKNGFLTEAESLLGFEIEYTSLSPSLLGHLEIRGFRLLSAETGKELIFVEKLKIFYSFFDFFRGEPMTAFNRIGIENTRIRWDSEVDELPAFLSGGGEEAGTIPELPRIQISGKNIGFEFSSSKQLIKGEEIYFKIEPAESGWDLNLEGAGSFIPSTSGTPPGNIFGKFKLNGAVNAGFTRADASLTVRDVESDYINLKKLSVLFSLKEKRIEFHKIDDRIPYDLKAGYDFVSEKAEMTFSSENFIPSNYFSFQKALDNLAPIFDVGFSGKLSADYDLKTGIPSYNAELELKVPVSQWVPVPLETEVVLSGNLSEVIIDELDLHSRIGELYFRGNLDLEQKIILPSGYLKVKELAYAGHEVSGMLYLDRQARYYSVQAPWVLFDGLSLNDTSVQLMGDLDNVDIFLETSSGNADWDNSLFAEGNFIMGEEPFFQILVESFDFPVGAASLVMLPDLNENMAERLAPLTLNSQGYLSSDLEKFSFNASRFELKNREVTDQFISLSVSGNNSGLSFRNLHLLYEELELLGEGNANWQDAGLLKFETDILFQDIPYSFEGTFEPEISLFLKGDYGIEATAYFQDTATFFNLVTEKLPVPVGENQYLVDLDLKGDFSSLTNWHLLINRGAVLNLPLDKEGERAAEISLRGRFAPREGQIFSLEYLDEYAPLTGNGEVHYNLANLQEGAEGWLQVYDNLSAESYALEFQYSEGALNGGLDLTGFPLERLGGDSLTGYLSGSGRIGGLLESPDITLKAALAEGQLNGAPFLFDAGFSLSGDVVRIDELKTGYLNNVITLESGEYNLAEGRAGLSGNFTGRLQESPLTAAFSLDADLIPLDSQFNFTQALAEPVTAVLNVKDIFILDQNHQDWDLDILYYEGRVDIKGGPQNSLEGFYDLDEGFEVAVLEPIPMNFRAKGFLADGNIDARLTDISMNFQTLEEYLSIPGFTLMSGEAVGGIQIVGPLADPDIIGELEVSDLTAILSFMNEPLKINRTTIVAEGKVLKIDNIIVSAEEGAAILNCEFNLDHLTPYDYSIYIETVTNQDPYLDFTFPYILAEGYARGILYIDGSRTELHVRGDVDVQSGHVVVDTAYEETREKKIDVIVDIGIGVGKGNTFYWPSRRLSILKAYGESGSTLRINVDTGKNTFALKGDVGVKGGEIFYFRRNFYLQDGIIVFNETKERFNPILDARAVIREVDSNGELVKIYLIADSMPFKSFEPRFESDPYLTNQEIVTMLGANLFNSTETDFENEVTLNEAILLTSDVVSQFGFVQNLQESVKTNLGLDVFSLRSQIVPNLILERFLLGEDEVTDSSFARYLDNTTLFIGKYLGNDFFLQGVIQMDYYDANPVDDLYFSPEFNIDTEVTLEWKSPVALIELSLYPDFFDTTDALLTSSLSLSWSFSF